MDHERLTLHPQFNYMSTEKICWLTRQSIISRGVVGDQSALNDLLQRPLFIGEHQWAPDWRAAFGSCPNVAGRQGSGLSSG